MDIPDTQWEKMVFGILGFGQVVERIGPKKRRVASYTLATSGFFVSATLGVAPYHHWDDDDAANVDTKVHARTLSNREITFRVVQVCKEADLVLMELTSLFTPFFLPLFDGEPVRSHPIVAHTLGMFIAMRGYESHRLHSFSGHVADPMSKNDPIFKYALEGGGLDVGDSGCAIVTADNYVIGMHIERLSNLPSGDTSEEDGEEAKASAPSLFNVFNLFGLLTRDKQAVAQREATHLLRAVKVARFVRKYENSLVRK